jgi:hypothetical protein
MTTGFSIPLEGLGIEELVDQVETVLSESLNDMIDQRNAYWVPLDQERAAMRGVAYEPIVVDAIADDAFHTFNIPSLVREEFNTLDNIPYVAIVPDDSAPDAEDARQDHRNVQQQLLSIHSIARTMTPAEDPELAGRRAVRIADAIYMTVLSDMRLSRKLKPLSNPVRVRVSEPFVFNVEGHGDEDYYWQAAGVQYAVKSYTTAP